MKKLYKKDSKGKIRIWTIETDKQQLIEKSGIKDGNLVEHIKTCKGKNIGKSNETTPEEQAKLELESRYKSKLDEGYFKTVKEAQNNQVLLPMLAKSYEDYKAKIDWNNCFIQPKLDGMRCLAQISVNGDVKLISRDGKTIENMDHIIQELSTIKKDIILDGELYAHGLSFQENMKLIKKYRPGETEQIIYNIYDIVSDYSFTNRFNNTTFDILFNKNYIFIVDTYQIISEEELKQYHAKFLQEGYEGSIIRWGDAPYKIDGRSENLLKYKDFQDIAAKIIDIEPAEQQSQWGVPVLEYNNKTFRAGTKMSHADREDLLNNKDQYIGKMGNIRFFEYTDDGIPRFPVMVGIHGDR